MKLWFKKSDGTFLSDQIAHRDPPQLYCHTELQFADGRFFSSSTMGQYHGTRFAWLWPSDERWDSIDVPLTEDAEAAVRKFCEDHSGEKYDFDGVAAFCLWFVHQDPDKWFCSEICTAALQSVGLMPDLIPCKTSPNRLYLRAKELFSP